jgi:FKBP-type peptidyl-prolyl cis-trans isomerase (trigger factor)
MKDQIEKMASIQQATPELFANLLSMLHESNTKIEALKALCMRHSVFNEEEYEDINDEINGLVKRTNGNFEDGDFVEATITGKDGPEEVFKYENVFFELNNDFIFYDNIINKPIASEVVFRSVVPDTHERTELRGKELAYRIKVHKVRVSKKEELHG